MKRSYRCLLLLPLLPSLLAAAGAAQAADALNGKALYLNGPAGGKPCAMCHTVSPTANVKNVLNAANRPERIAYAIGANLGTMGTLYTGRFSNAELADIAAFIANPNVTGAPAAAINPATLTFPVSAIGTTASPLTTSLSNTGNADLHVSTIALSGANAGDYTLGGTCVNGAVVAAGGHCDVQVGFKPSALGARTASVVINHDAAGGSSSVALSGTGGAVAQGTVGLSATAIDFGALTAGSVSAPRSVTVNNTGAAALTLNAIAVGGTNAAAFSLGGTCAALRQLAAGASCTVIVTAHAPASGAFSGNLVLTTNASNGTVSVALAGTVATASTPAPAPVPALVASPTSLGFGDVTIGRPPTEQLVTLVNTGDVALTLDGIAVSGSATVTVSGKTCGATLATGASCTVRVAFAPTAPGPVAATLTVTSSADPVRVAVTGNGTAAPVSVPRLTDTGPIAFDDTPVGITSGGHTLTLTNTGAAALKIASLAMEGTQAADFLLAGTCAVGKTLAQSASCLIDLAFRPTAAGGRAATLVVTTDAGARLERNLGGTGIVVAASTPVPVLTVNPQSVDFGSADVNGTAATHRITVSNTGTAPAVLTAAAFAGPFALADTTGCAAFPYTLAAGASCDLSVRFAPAGGGGASGTLTLATDGELRPQVALSGNGVVPAAPSTPAAPAKPGTPENAGGGGCSTIKGGNDPMLPALVILSIGVLLWRRFVRKER